MKYCRLISLFALAFLPVSAMLAEAASPRDDFRAGVAAFEEGDLESAKRLMEQAREAGLTSPSLIYSLGVVYYRLELYDKAESAFSRLLDTPHAPLARYNLGLVLQQRGDSEGAQQWFREVAGSDSPEEIRTLAQRQLARDSVGNGVANDGLTKVMFLSVGGGYDDNITGAPSTESTDESGGFGELLVSGRAYFNQPSGDSLRLEAVAYRRQYPDNAQYSNTYAATGLAWESMVGDGRLVSAANLSGLWFGGDLLERQAGLELMYSGEDCVADLRCILRGFAAAVRGGSGYSAYDGSLYGVDANLGKTFSQWTAELGYRLDIDRREDLTTADEFFSLSPTRHKVSIDLDYQLSRRWTLGATQSLRFSRYDDPHRLNIGGGTVTETRDDERVVTTLRSGYQFDRRWRLGMELSWVNNASSIDRYEYDRTEMLVTLDGVF